MKINLWRFSFLIAVPVTLALIVWLSVTLPLDQPKLFIRLIAATGVMVSYSLLNGYKIIVKGC